MKKLTLLASLITLLASGCTTSAPAPVSSDGTKIEVTKAISGDVDGDLVGPNTKIAMFGAFLNLSGNKINLANKTIDEDITLAVAPVQDGKYEFGLPKAPQKANGAIIRIFAFNDDNSNNSYDEGEEKTKEGKVTWSSITGYSGAQDADGNVVGTLGDFKDFDFRFNSETSNTEVTIEAEAG